MFAILDLPVPINILAPPRLKPDPMRTNARKENDDANCVQTAIEQADPTLVNDLKESEDATFISAVSDIGAKETKHLLDEILMPDPIRATVLKLKELPMVANSPADMALEPSVLSRANERNESEDDIIVWPTIEQFMTEPIASTFVTESDDPNRDICRKDSDELRPCIASKTDMADPRRVKLLTERADPKSQTPSTLLASETRPRPTIDALDPNLA
jgi:hypothetical protein